MSEPEEPSQPSASGDAIVGEKSDAPAVSVRRTPPPLPAFASQPPPAMAPEPVAPAAKRSTGKTIAYGAILIALLALAAAAGLGFGDLVQRKPTASTVVMAPPPAPPAASSATPQAAPSAATVTLPAVEIK